MMNIIEGYQLRREEARQDFLRRGLSNIIDSSLKIISSRGNPEASYARIFPTLLASRKIQIVSNLPCIEEPEEVFPYIVDYESEGETGVAIFLLVKEEWLENLFASRNWSDVSKLVGSIMGAVEGCNICASEGTRVLTREEIASDIEEKGIKLYFE